ncbi:vitamin D 25-hydroxylase-like [Centruroides sculpturatus]|uniref:vitamin D 25-hydroxylase-like n=1 Tax=Centruroides sculpturatus TaxID=218467 RepID=UPI000C6D2562|nr:vitamin D 25-hydroxylase-like [Centruroides sculpturatus]
MQNLWNYYYVPFLVALSLIILNVLKDYFLRPKNFPSGPSGLPFVGYLPFLGEEAYLKLHKLRLKYGGIFSVLLGSKRVVVLSSYDVMKEAYSKSALLGLPPITNFDFLFKLKGIAKSSGEEWVENRRFVVNNLRIFNERYDLAIEEEIPLLLEELARNEECPLNIQRLLLSSASNVILNFASGIRFDYHHPTRKIFNEFIEMSAKYLGVISYSVFVPWIKFLHLVSFVMDRSIMQKTINAYEKLIDIFESVFKEYNSKNIKNISEAYICEIEKSKNNPESPYTVLGYVGNITTILAASFDTTTASLSWTILALATYLKIQRKVQKEIDAIFGTEYPVWKDRARLPYTQAVIMEIQRWRTIVPLSGLRYALSDCKIREYIIPKGTIVVLNIWSIHNDPSYWENPEEFLPERFLTEDGLSIKKLKSFSPFSYGKRSCPAEGIAYKEIFLFLTSILQKFEVAWPKSTPPDLGVKGGGIVLMPKPYQLIFIPRK